MAMKISIYKRKEYNAILMTYFTIDFDFYICIITNSKILKGQ